MTIQRIVGSFVSLVVVGGVLSLMFPGLFVDKVTAASKTPTHFQTVSNALGGRFLAGPFAAGTQLGISSLTVAAPGQSTSTQFGIRVFHGVGATCEDLSFGPAPLFAAVPADATLHLTFPEPLVATHASESWCLYVDQGAVFTQITIVGVMN
jgi:hypothetical protein